MKAANVSTYLVEITEEYFQERWVVSGQVKRRCTMGVPQGSVKGPRLWDITYDGVLNLPYGERVTALAYADDLLFLIEEDTETDLRRSIEGSVKMAAGWMRSRGLELAPQKTECMVIKGPRKRGHIRLSILGREITPSRSLTYLGVVWDSGMTFGLHIAHVVEKAGKKVEAMRRLLPNVGGPSYYKKRTLCTVLHSVIAYAAPVWREAMKREKYRGQLLSVQRRGLLRVISAY